GAGYDTRITGIKAFDVKKLCRNWLPLLRQINSNITRVAVIYDQDPVNVHKSMHAQYEEIKNSMGPLSPQTFHADDPNTDPTTKRQDVNPHIDRDIAHLAEGDGPAGLIVTAGTRTLLLRKKIVEAVNDAN